MAVKREGEKETQMEEGEMGERKWESSANLGRGKAIS